MGMMTEYYHYFFTTLVRNTEDLGMFFFSIEEKSARKFPFPSVICVAITQGISWR